jgi:hypothetical protein
MFFASDPLHHHSRASGEIIPPSPVAGHGILRKLIGQPGRYSRMAMIQALL